MEAWIITATRSPRVVSGGSHETTIRACGDRHRATAAQEQAVVRAAVAYVTAWRDWDTGEGYAPKHQQAMHVARRELVRAVEGLGETGGTPC